MYLIIDGVECDVKPGQSIDIGFDADKLASPDALSESRRVSLWLAATPRNRELFDSPLLNAVWQPYNLVEHEASLIVGGALIVEGQLRLLRFSSEEGYLVEISETGSNWAMSAALKQLHEVGIEMPSDYRYDLVSFRDHWTSEHPVKFLPLVCRSLDVEHSGSLSPYSQSVFMAKDYHPFVSVDAMVRGIFAQAGYELQSEFMQSQLFRELYMSGSFADVDTARQELQAGFKASRNGDKSAVADGLGRVTAQATESPYSIGNIVQTALFGDQYEAGGVIDGLYNNGNAFTIENGEIVYRPKSNLTVAFEYKIRYETDYRILSRDRLLGFDRVNLDLTTSVAVELSNKLTDNRSDIRGGFRYLAVVFGYEAGQVYRLSFYGAGGREEVFSQAFSSRSEYINVPDVEISESRLFLSMGTWWQEVVDDYALYDGHNSESGQMVVELTVQSSSYECGPSSPVYFRHISFDGAEAGMAFKICKETTVRSVFASTPGYMDELQFSDLMRVGARQIELLEAIAQMFNLRFLTDERRKVVYVEPYDETAEGVDVVDWSDRIVYSEPIEEWDATLEEHSLRELSYQGADVMVAQYNADEGTQLGVWSYDSGSKGAIFGKESIVNPLFAPTVSREGLYDLAPSACLMQVGDISYELESLKAENGVRIIRYVGMHPLPDGQRWPYPLNESQYPLAGFFFGGDEHREAFTLGFEDRDGVLGLHQFYDKQFERQSLGRYVSVSLRIRPSELEMMMTPGSGAVEYRSEFLLRVTSKSQERQRCVLRTIEEYNPETQIAKCTFTIINDHD